MNSNTMRKAFQRPIAFHRILAQLTGSVAAGLMLSQATYWQGIVDAGNGGKNGFFFKTGAEWKEETVLGRREQFTARKHLRELVGIVDGEERHVWNEELKGVPAKLYYRVDWEALESAIEQFNENDGRDDDGDDEQGSPPSSPKARNKYAQSAQQDEQISQTIYTETTTDITATAAKTDDTTVCFCANAESEKVEAVNAVAEQAGSETAQEDLQDTGTLFNQTEPAMQEVVIPPAGKGKSKGKKSGEGDRTVGKLMQDILAAYIEVLGYKPNVPSEVRAAKALAEAGALPEDVVRCYSYYKSQAFWKDKHLGLASVRKNFEAFKAVEKSGDRKYVTPTGRIDLRMSKGDDDSEQTHYSDEDRAELLRQYAERQKRIEELRAEGRYDAAFDRLEYCRVNGLPIPDSLKALRLPSLSRVP